MDFNPARVIRPQVTVGVEAVPVDSDALDGARKCGSRRLDEGAGWGKRRAGVGAGAVRAGRLRLSPHGVFQPAGGGGLYQHPGRAVATAAGRV